MAGRLYRMAKVVSANPKSWGIVDANEISGFKRVAKLSDLYSIAECILSSSYGDGVTDGVDAVGQIWHVSETNGDYKLTNWANRKSAAGWTKLSYGDNVSVPVKDVQVNGTTVLSNGIANVNLNSYLQNYATLTTTDTLEGKINKNAEKINDNLGQINSIKNRIGAKKVNNIDGIATLDEKGYVPIEQLGNLDTTVYKVLGTNEALPTTGIKSCIYLKLIETGNPTDDNNKYAEYVYTGNIAGTYDATKWEKLGEVAAKTDLSEYYKKTEVNDKLAGLARTLTSQDVYNFTIIPSSRGEQGVGRLYYMQASITRKDANPLSAIIPCVVSAADTTNANAGLMSPADKQKLDEIAVGANKTIIDAEMSTTSTNAVQNKVIDGAIKTHKVNSSNFKDSSDVAYSGNSLLFYSQIDDGITYHDIHNASYRIVKTTDGTPKIAYSANGSTYNSYLLRDIDMVALTDTELNEILK